MTVIGKYLDASTAHLPAAERDLLTAGLDVSCPRVVPHEYGWWVNVPCVPSDIKQLANEHDCPALVAALKAARALDCDWINFDCDADFVDDLPTYGEETE